MPHHEKAVRTSAPEFLSVAEAADRLRVDRKTIHKAIAARALPFIKLGRVIRIPMAGLSSLISKSA